MGTSAGELWREEIDKCQEEISKLTIDPFYNIYKLEEVKYWSKIAGWIYEDQMTRHIERCLDIGCAYGTLALFCRKIIGCEVYCTDFLASYLSPTLIEKYNLTFALHNIELEPLPWKFKFDMIILTEVIEHFNFHPLPTLRNICNLLSDDRRFYLSTPDASSGWGRITKYYSTLDEIPPPVKGTKIIDEHIYQYTKEELLNILRMAGFKVGRFDYAPGGAPGPHFNLTLSKSTKLTEP